MANEAILPFTHLHTTKRTFLAAYLECGLMRQAARNCGIDISNHYHWKRTDPAYVEAFTEAHNIVAELHEEEASRRALGWDETRYTNDGTAYTLRKYSDTLLIFRLKALKPEMYRDSYPHDKGQDISELLKAVLLELHRHQENLQAIPAEFSPRAPSPPAPLYQLPAPPSPDDDARGAAPSEERRPW